jgi:L,D-peptidoglycan transpeptidase YkuD (ErfK/YbiS/YcfS/YnhG family)
LQHSHAKLQISIEPILYAPKNIGVKRCSQPQGLADIYQVLIPHKEAKIMASAKQKAAARKNIKKAATAAKKKRTISHLSKSTRTALGKQGAKVAKRKRKAA